MDARSSAVIGHDALSRLLKPRTVAIVGLRGTSPIEKSLQPASVGAAEVFVVSPRHKTVLGRPAYPSLSSIGRSIDAVLSVMPERDTARLVEEAALLDIGGVVAVAAGDGAAPRARLATAARSTGIPLIGPGSLGFVNVPHGVSLTLAAPHRRRPGGISVVAQRGELLGSVERAAWRHPECGLNLLISSGGEAVTDLADYVDYLAADPETRAIGLVVERIRRPEAFFAATRRAIGAGKPVAMLQVGRAERAPHGALLDRAPAEDGWMYDVALRQVGITVVADPEELVRSIALPERLAFLEHLGWDLGTMETGHPGLRPDAETRADRAPARPRGMQPRRGTAVARTYPRCRGMRGAPASGWRRGGTGALGPARQVPHRWRGAKGSARHREDAGRDLPTAVTSPPWPGGPSALSPEGHVLSFDATMKTLAAAGIRVAPYRVIPANQDPRTVRVSFPGPYVVKLADVRNRPEHGGGIRGVTADDLDLAVADLRLLAAEQGMSPLVVVQQQVKVLGEAFIGIMANSELGPLVLFGPGGPKDAQRVGGRMAPLSLSDAHSLIGEFTDTKVMWGVGGRPAWDLEALADLLIAAGKLAVTARRWMDVLDLDSLVYSPSGFVAVDACCLMREDAHGF